MILKLLLLIAVITVVYFVFFKKPQLKSKTKKPKTEDKSSDMVECAKCGVYSEINESILSSGKYYCSDECLRS